LLNSDRSWRIFHLPRKVRRPILSTPLSSTTFQSFIPVLLGYPDGRSLRRHILALLGSVCLAYKPSCCFSRRRSQLHRSCRQNWSVKVVFRPDKPGDPRRLSSPLLEPFLKDAGRSGEFFISDKNLDPCFTLPPATFWLAILLPRRLGGCAHDVPGCVGEFDRTCGWCSSRRQS